MKFGKFPSALTVLMIIAAMVAVATWFIPAGQYNMLTYDSTENVFKKVSKTGVSEIPATQEMLTELNVEIPLEKFTSGAIYKPIAIPDTYQSTESDPQGIFEYVQAPVKGIIETADIIFLVLIIGGLIGIVNATGAFNAGIAKLAEMLKGREFILIIATTVLVALGGSTFGMAEETIAFLPILIPVFLAAKYDTVVCVASVFLGSSVGNMCSTTNPFSVIIASDIAGINWTSGIEGRLLMFFICISATIVFILLYAKRVKADPKSSIVSDRFEEMKSLFRVSDEPLEIPQLTSRLKLILLVFIISFVIMIFGVSRLDWWFIEMSATFLSAAIIIGFIARMPEAKFTDNFIRGAGDLLGVAFIIGLARGITILMSEGMITDTILFHAISFVEGMGETLFINSLFFVYNFLTLFISSTSGTAVLTMPIMAPLADSLGLGREMVVNAFVMGNGLCSIISPIGIVLPTLAMAKIGYDRWLRFVWPLLVALAVICVLFLSLSVYI